MCESVMKCSHSAMSYKSKSYFWLSTGKAFFSGKGVVKGHDMLFAFWKRQKKRKISKVCLSSLRSILAELLLSDHQSCSFIKDLAEGHARQKKILSSSNNEQLKVAGKLKVLLSSPYIWLCKELYLISEQWKTSLSLCDSWRNEILS